MRQDYIKMIEYRTDIKSEERVGTLNIILPVSIFLFLVIFLGLGWKIKQYKKSIKDTKEMIAQQKKSLIQKQDEVLRLRRLKLLRLENQERMAEIEGANNENLNALADLVGGIDQEMKEEKKE